MKTYKFEIQSLITVEIEGFNAEQARRYVINQLERGEYTGKLCQNCVVSDGKEL